MDRLDEIYIWHIVTLSKMKLEKRRIENKWKQ